MDRRPLRLATARLVVREYALDDVDDVAATLADPRVFWWREEPYDREGALGWLAEEIGHVERDGTGRYAVVLRATGRVIGGVGLVPRRIDDGDEIEIGWHLDPREWGRGYATEAARALLAEARSRGLRRVVALITPANVRSQAVARRLGLNVERQVDWAGQTHDLWVAPDQLPPRREV